MRKLWHWILAKLGICRYAQAKAATNAICEALHALDKRIQTHVHNKELTRGRVEIGPPAAFPVDPEEGDSPE